ncbi:uroporphyrinogen-III synthase [Lysinibacter cavernae]|uniref:Uroporphyrinogen-III synthase n=1 Tax=Lysinibacter cavernae TaxID=1640652 RepID=A0A7X5TU56_9MICO|nr:uroporphyrinogen-III synthase [Lysinibacter cavernae]NIH54895.1 uroporphyrinogen-III synthase [Lysinibacter cavernae]
MTETKALSGWRVLVPRGGPWGDRVAASLRNNGAQPVIAPLINFAPTDEAESLTAALARLAAGEFAWITATSATVVDVLAHHNAVIPPGTKVAAVGETTAAAFAAAGYTVDITPLRENTAYGLLEEWHEIREGSPLKVLTLRSNTAVPVLTKGLLALGHDVTQVVAFRTVGVPVTDRIREDVASGKINALLITSGSVAEQVREQFPNLPEGTLLACVGPQTKKDAEARGLRIDVVADERTTESLVNAVASVADTEGEH